MATMLNSQLFVLPQHIPQRENSDKATMTTSVTHMQHYIEQGNGKAVPLLN
jgi:hypothetical protein